MALPTHYTGTDGVITIGGVATTLVNFNVDMSVGVIESPRIGKKSAMKYPGKLDFSGTVTQVVVTGDLMARVIGTDQTESSAALFHGPDDLDSQGVHEQITVGPDTSANPTSVKLTLAASDTSANDAGSMVVQGTDASGAWVSEVFEFDAMDALAATQVKYGSQIFASVHYIDVSGNLSQGVGTAATSLAAYWVGGTKTITPGNTPSFDIVGKVEDANGKYFQMTLTNCFFTGAGFPISDSETLVQTDLPFVVQDPDVDVVLVWSAV